MIYCGCLRFRQDDFGWNYSWISKSLWKFSQSKKLKKYESEKFSDLSLKSIVRITKGWEIWNFSFAYLLLIESSFVVFYLTIAFDSFARSFSVYKIEEASYKKSCKFYSGQSLVQLTVPASSSSQPISYSRPAGFSTWRPVCILAAAYSYALPQFPKLRSWLRTNHKPTHPPFLRQKVYLRCVSISVLNDLWSGNPQNHCQGVIPFSCVYKDILIFRQLKELFFAVL